MPFKGIKGQDRAIDFLKRSLARGRIAHAYLFSGPDGIGKRTTAVEFAKAMNCLSESSAKPCGACVSCKKIDSGNHPDLFYIEPEKDGGSIKIDTIRQLIRNASLKAYEGRFKIFIIDSAESMTEEAANALLKTLEEPPKDSVLILVSGSPDRLLPTITSRTQGVRFFPLGVEEAAGILHERHGMEITRARLLANITGGCIGKAVEFNENGFFDKRARVIKALANRTLFDSDFDGLSKSDFKLYLDIMLTFFRDILVAKTLSPDEALFNPDRSGEIRAEARGMEMAKLDGIIKQIVLTGSFQDRNVNRKIALAALGLNITVK